MKKNTKKKIHTAFEKWKRLALSLAILIVLNVFFNVGIQTFYDEPQYDDYCATRSVKPFPQTQEACVTQEGVWNPYDEPYVGPEGINETGYCDLYQTCNDNYQEVRAVYNRNVFLVLSLLGAAMLILSLYLNITSAVLSGLAYGGVLSILIGTMRYWSDMDEYLRFIVTGIMLVVLIGVGVKKFKD